MSIRSVLPLVTLALFAGCQEPPAAPDLDTSVAFTQGGAAACPTAATFVVSDAAGLAAALAAAVAGDVIGVDGTIALSGVVFLGTAGITLTCATAGSGFVAAGGFPHNYLFRVTAPDVTIDRLRLDGSGTLNGAVVTNVGITGLVFTNNRVLAGPTVGVFFPGAAGVTATDNTIEAANPTTVTGLHMQSGIDGSVVSRNTVRALVATGSVPFGGIRLRDGAGVIAADNRVIGPWTNGFSLTNLQGSQIERNHVQGAVNFGLATSFNPGATQMTGNVFRNNRFSGTGSAASVPPFGLPPAGLMMRLACGNTFIGNNLNGNFNNVGAIFTVPTGANTMNANQNVVFDDGDFDCNGDLVSDPNVISGKALKGGFGQIISDGASSTGGMK